MKPSSEQTTSHCTGRQRESQSPAFPVRDTSARTLGAVRGGLISWFAARPVPLIVVTVATALAFVSFTEVREHIRIIEEDAVQDAQSITTMITEFQSLYSALIVGRAAAFGMEVVHDFENRPDTLPNPMTMSELLGDRLAQSNSGIRIRLLSDSPFPWRDEGGAQDDFEHQALTHFQSNSKDPFFQIERVEEGKRLRYATADIMGESCIACHNSDPQSPRRDWKVGDVRGVLSVTVPIKSDVSRAIAATADPLGLFIGLTVLCCVAIFIVMRINKSNTRLATVVDEQSTALAQSDSEITAILNATADAIIVIDEAGLITTLNAAAEMMFGHTAQEAIGQNVAMLMEASIAREHDSYLNKYHNSGRGGVIGRNRDMLGLRNDGSVFPLLLRVSELFHNGDKRFVANIQDITERTVFEERIKDLAKIPGECPHPVLRIAADGTVLYANEPSAIILGSLRCAVGEFVPADWLAFVDDALESGDVLSYDLDCVDRIFSFQIVPFAEHSYVNLYGQEVTAQRHAERRLRHDALHDTLTSLPNRALLMERLSESIEQSKRDPHYRFALLFLDFDGFKVVNDSLGHQVGDQLLIGIAGRLNACLRTADSVTFPSSSQVARIGGDEFVILLDDIRHSDDAVMIGNRIQETMTDPFLLQGHKVVTSVSIGIASNDRGYDCADAMVRDADAAMYCAKAKGKARCEVFDPSMHDAAMDRLELEVDLRRALETSQFRLLYQPILSLKTHEIVSMEALLRWHHPTRGLMFPDQFIPLAEELGLIVPIGRWVLEEASNQLALWHKATSMSRPIAVNINISGKQISSSGFLEELEQILHRTQAPRDSVNLEITETVIMENTDVIKNVLDQAKQLGVELHMDNFGTGYSSLSNLHQLPFDVLKIDRSFMENVDPGLQLTAVVHSVVELAHNLNMKVTAEGIETKDQLAKALALECDYGQGFHFAHPLSVQDATSLIKAQYQIRKSA